MIEQLYIKNVAVIKEITINFSNGLNIFTGETGAGKSIIIDSINAVLGNRTSKTIIRYGEKKAEITAVFSDIKGCVISKLKDLDLYNEEDELLILYRSITPEGKNNCKINNKPITVNTLKEIGNLLVDIHGQQDNGYLLKEKNHQIIIDNYGKLYKLKNDYKDLFKNLVKKKKQLDLLLEVNFNKEQKVDLLKFQINEINDADTSENFDENILSEKINSYRYLDKIISNLNNCYNIIRNNENNNLTDMISECEKSLISISGFDSKIDNIYDKINQTKYLLEDISTEISLIIEEKNVNIDIDYLENRLDTVKLIKSKYGNTVADILDFQNNAEEQLKTIINNDIEIDKLEEEADKILIELKDISERLSKIREDTTLKFINDIKNQLMFLNMPNVNVDFINEKGKLKSNGIDNIILLLSTNKGQPPQSISKVASGGELSRIMLAIKTLISNDEMFSTLIFDEV
ncbi:MAG: DNA repair protein RecN, partial [Oscillospiraceae bacterium]